MAETTDAGIDVQHETARQRFVVQVDGKEGTLSYRRRDDHTLTSAAPSYPRSCAAVSSARSWSSTASSTRASTARR